MISRWSTPQAHRPARRVVRHALLVFALLYCLYGVQVGTPASTTRVAGTLYPCGGICSQTTVIGAQTVV